MDAKTKKTAIVIGAGPAGLTAAYTLLKNTDMNVIVLEESGAIGGISRTVTHNGNRMDIGGHRFFSKDEKVNNFWKSLMPVQGAPSLDDALLGRNAPLSKGGPDPERDERVMLLRNRVSRIYFLKKFFAYPITLTFETVRNMGFCRAVRAGFGYAVSAVFKKKEVNLRNFYINRFGKPLYEMFFEDYTEKVWGVKPEHISAEWGAQRVKGLSLFRAVWTVLTKPFRKKGAAKVETSLIEEFMYPKRGPGQLWEALADEVREAGGEMIFHCGVSAVHVENGAVVSVTAGGRAFYGDYFLSSMPVKDLIQGMNGVPESLRKVAENLPYRDFITVGLLCNRLKIKNETKIPTLGGIVPDCWIYIQDRGVKLGRLQIFNNWSPYMVKDPVNTVWIGLEYFCAEGDEMWNMPDEAFIRFAAEELARIGIADKSDIDVKNSVRVKVRKAYPSYFGAYERFGEVKEFLLTIKNLHCIGRNGQHRYNNMDHSMLTGMAAAEAIRTGEGQRAVWDINAEKAYHEKK